MYFTGGGESSVRTGETMAIAPRTGEVLWRTSEAYASQTGTPSYRDGRIYLPGAYKLPMFCLAAHDGRVLWKQDSIVDRWHVETCSLGRNFLAVNNKYKGGAWRWSLSDGSLVGSPEKPIQLWGPATVAVPLSWHPPDSPFGDPGGMLPSTVKMSDDRLEEPWIRLLDLPESDRRKRTNLFLTVPKSMERSTA